MIICLGPSPTLQRTMRFSRLALDGVNRASEVRVLASGKAINAARVAHMLGAAVVAMGFAGGETGRALLAELDAAGVRRRFVDVGAPTRVCVTAIDESAHTATELVEESGVISREAVKALLRALRQVLAEHNDGERILILAGTLAAGMAEDFYGRCCAMAERARTRVIIDARGAALLVALPHRPAVVKINREELAATAKRALHDDDEVRAAMRELMDGGAQAVIVTNGAEPILVCDKNGTKRIHVPAVDVVSAIGSGDAFNGGLAVGMLGGLPLFEEARRATAVAVANAMTAYPGVIDLKALGRLMDQTTLTD